MAKISIIVGVLMTLIGFGGVWVATMDGKSPKTALIPVVIGVLVALFGVVSGIKEGARKHLMHVSMLLALIGLGGIVGRWISAGTFTNPEFSVTNALIVQLSFAVVSAVYIILGIKSFIDARRG